MKKKILLSLALGGLSVLCGCDAQVKTTASGIYQIKVIDIDGEVLADENISIAEYPTVKSALEAMDLKGYTSDYGYTITSIKGSVIDSNYYVAIYENDAYASTGVDGLTVNDSDKFLFQVECWNSVESGYGTMDSYDILADQALYHKVKEMKKALSDATTYKDSKYWERNIFYRMKEEGYDEALFTPVYSTEFEESVKNTDMTSLSGADYAKWYYAARYMCYREYDSFLVQFENYLKGLTGYGLYDEYTLPFTTSIAKSLNVESDISADVTGTSYRADTTYGPDGLAWELTGLSMYQDIKDFLSLLTEDALNSSYSKDVSLASYLMAYASFGVNPRDYCIGNKDILEALFDTYYSDCSFETEKLGESDYSSNQIYAALAAYKIERDKGIKVNIFA